MLNKIPRNVNLLTPKEKKNTRLWCKTRSFPSNQFLQHDLNPVYMINSEALHPLTVCNKYWKLIRDSRKGQKKKATRGKGGRKQNDRKTESGFEHVTDPTQLINRKKTKVKLGLSLCWNIEMIYLTWEGLNDTKETGLL